MLATVGALPTPGARRLPLAMLVLLALLALAAAGPGPSGEAAPASVLALFYAKYFDPARPPAKAAEFAARCPAGGTLLLCVSLRGLQLRGRRKVRGRTGEALPQAAPQVPGAPARRARRGGARVAPDCRFRVTGTETARNLV